MVPVPGYFLDGASAIAAAVMDVAPGASVLDLCAAPGGKSVMLASMLFSTASILVTWGWMVYPMKSHENPSLFPWLDLLSWWIFPASPFVYWRLSQTAHKEGWDDVKLRWRGVESWSVGVQRDVAAASAATAEGHVILSASGNAQCRRPLITGESPKKQTQRS